MGAAIEITEKAKKQLKELKVDRDRFLRLWVTSGGCSGLSYQAAIDDILAPNDETLYEDDSLKVVSDPKSAQYMQGMHIDYSDDLVKAGFRFHNPNAVSTCGCGGSFQTSCNAGGCG